MVNMLDAIPPQLLAIERAIRSEFGGVVEIRHIPGGRHSPPTSLKFEPLNPLAAGIVLFYASAGYLLISDFHTELQSEEEAPVGRADSWALEVVRDIGRFGIAKIRYRKPGLLGVRDETILLQDPDHLERLSAENDLSGIDRREPW